jgi:hypothetical protein
VVAKIREHGDSLAMVLLSGVHYFTGQLFDIETITRAAHDAGCYIGWDLAHAVGNVELRLNEWQVDFAAWCTYKYLNAGAGSIGAIFVHEKHFEAVEARKLKKLDGWWSHRFDTRFQMSNGTSLSLSLFCFLSFFFLFFFLFCCCFSIILLNSIASSDGAGQRRPLLCAQQHLDAAHSLSQVKSRCRSFSFFFSFI